MPEVQIYIKNILKEKKITELGECRLSTRAGGGWYVKISLSWTGCQDREYNFAEAFFSTFNFCFD